MPPRKSDVRASTPIAAEETSPPAKPQQEKKDKDKEKDAQKAKGEDAITIEVCACVCVCVFCASCSGCLNINP